MSEKQVNLIECFNSYQGEGPDSGVGMIILRFKTCNLKCPWCDTAVKMRISMEAPYQLSTIQQTINEKRLGILVTGGEPTVPKHFEDTVTLLNELTYPIANVESNGFNLEELIKRVNPTKNVHYIYSPKIFSAVDLISSILKTQKLLNTYHNVYIKMVYEPREDVLNYLNEISNSIDIEKATRVWLMPEGVTRADLIRNSGDVMDACEKYRFNFSSRDHIIYGYI